MKPLKKIVAAALSLAIVGMSLAGCAGKHAELQFKEPQKGQQIATMKIKDYGDVKIMLFPKQAPKAVENFTTHAKDGYYNGLNFHRVMANFMIQGGDPDGIGAGGESIWGEAFEDEFSPELRNFTGALSMANSGVNTNGSQFFIVNTAPITQQQLDYFVDQTKQTREAIKSGQVPQFESSYADKYGEINYDKADAAKYAEVGGTPWLDNVHTVFGQVYEGLDIVQKVMETETDASDAPTTPVVIETIEISTY